MVSIKSTKLHSEEDDPCCLQENIDECGGRAVKADGTVIHRAVAEKKYTLASRVDQLMT